MKAAPRLLIRVLAALDMIAELRWLTNRDALLCKTRPDSNLEYVC